jgi:hypothetical protein
MTAPKEAFYDERIAPLMTLIIALCKEAKINMIADFSLGYDEERDEPLYCTTCLPAIDSEDEHGVERIKRAYRAIRPQRRSSRTRSGGEAEDVTP